MKGNQEKPGYLHNPNCRRFPASAAHLAVQAALSSVQGLRSLSLMGRNMGSHRSLHHQTILLTAVPVLSGRADFFNSGAAMDTTWQIVPAIEGYCCTQQAHWRVLCICQCVSGALA